MWIVLLQIFDIIECQISYTPLEIGSLSSPTIVCPQNTLRQLHYLDATVNELNIEFNCPSSQQIKVIVEYYLTGQLDTGNMKVFLSNQLLIEHVFPSPEMKLEYSGHCGLHSLFGGFTLQETRTIEGAQQFLRFNTNIMSTISTGGILIGHIQVLAQLCSQFCKTCIGPEAYECITCFVGSPVGGVCGHQCPLDKQFFQSNFGCKESCDDNQVLDGNGFCVFNRFVSLIHQTTTFTDWIYPAQQIVDGFPGIYDLPGGTQKVIYFQNRSGIKQMINCQPSAVEWRVKATIYVFGQLDLDTYIMVQVKGSVLIRIKYHVSGVYVVVGDNGYIISQIVNNLGFTMIEVEGYYRILIWEVQLTVKIRADLKLYSNRMLGVGKLSVFEVLCSKNCATCLNYSKCQTCVGGYYMYKSDCVNICPNDSEQSGQSCISYDQNPEITPYPIRFKYLLKGFYNLEMADWDTLKYFGQPIATRTNFIKDNAEFSYTQDKRIFGGPLTWANAVYTQEYQLTAPNSGYTIRMQVVLGDNFIGNSFFRYQINASPPISFDELTTNPQVLNVLGKPMEDRIFNVEEYISNNLSNKIILMVECNIDPSLEASEAFCAIQNFFIIVHECPLFCAICLGKFIHQCNQWDIVTNQVVNSADCQLGYYGDPIQNSCVSCTTISGCFNGCIDSQTCTSCLAGNQLIQGECKCYDSYYLTIIDNVSTCLIRPICTQQSCNECDPYNPAICIFCNGNKFILNQNICQCDQFYYQNGNNCDPCANQCRLCDGGTRSDCLDWNCHYTCQSCNGSSYDNCTSCNIQAYRQPYGNGCICQHGYQQYSAFTFCEKCTIKSDDQYSGCYSNCGDQIVQWNEECDDGNSILFDGCYQCKYQCESVCSHCVNGKCYHCQIGWLLNSITNICEEVCGDGIQVGNEQCDDGNSNPNDGCYQCKYQCDLLCSQCFLGNCLVCSSGSEILNDGFCHPICGDMVINQFEDCDDGNDIPYDGCYNCKFQCQSSCNECQFGKCYSCNVGWDLINNVCIKCGDGLMISPFKECDDNNMIDRDGCTQCKIDPDYYCNHQEFTLSICYKCSQNCIHCILQNTGNPICQLCYPGYFLTNNNDCVQCGIRCISCISSPNSCKECRHKDLNCSICESVPGYYEDIRNDQCQTKCGDGILILINEECDDGNLINGDGCDDQCKIESGYVCKLQYYTSSCSQYSAPILVFGLMNRLSNEASEVQVQFDMKVTIITKDNMIMQGYIENLQVDQYHINVTTISQPGNVADNIIFTIQISIQVSIDNPLLILTVLENTIMDENQNLCPTITSQLRLNDVLIMSSTEQEVAKKVFDFNTAFLYFLICLTFLSILTGDLGSLWNVLDLLQQISYLKYMNVKYPYLIADYFSIFDIVSIDTLLEYIGIIQPSLFDFEEGGDKFQENNVSVNFMYNIFSFLVVLVISYLFILIIQLGQLFITPGRIQSNLSIPKQSKAMKYLLELKLYQRTYQRLGFQILLTQSSYDILFACWLQIMYGQPNTILQLAKYYVAIVVLLVQSTFSLLQFKSITKNYQQTEIYSIQGSYWSQQYIGFQLLKRIIFISLIVCCQSSPIEQAAGLSLTSFIFAIYIMIVMPLKDNKQNYQIIATELIISISAINLLTFKVDASIIPLTIKSKLVWVQVAILSLLILGQGSYDLLVQAKIMPTRIWKTWHQLKSCCTK